MRGLCGGFLRPSSCDQKMEIKPFRDGRLTQRQFAVHVLLLLWRWYRENLFSPLWWNNHILSPPPPYAGQHCSPTLPGTMGRVRRGASEHIVGNRTAWMTLLIQFCSRQFSNPYSKNWISPVSKLLHLRSLVCPRGNSLHC